MESSGTLQKKIIAKSNILLNKFSNYFKFGNFDNKEALNKIVKASNVI